MILKQVILRHFCQHGYLQWDLYPGLNVVVGPIGAGKSNTFRAIKGSLIGDFESRTMGSKSQDKSYNAPADAEVEAQTTWQLRDGTEFTVLRNVLKTGSAKLFVAGQVEFTGVEQAVTDRIEAITGYSKTVIDACMFIKQGQIDNVFTLTPARRVEVLVGLTDASLAEAADVLLRDYEVVDKHRRNSYDESEYSVARSQFSSAKENLVVRDQIRAVEQQVLSNQEYEAIRNSIESVKTRNDLTRSIADAVASLQERKKESELKQKKYREWAMTVMQAEDSLRQAKEDFKKAEIVYNENKHKADQYDKLVKLKETIASAPPTQPEPVEPISDTASLEELVTAIAKEDATISAYNLKVCGTCKRPYNVSEEDFLESNNKKLSLTSRLRARERYVKAIETFQKDFAVYTSQMKSWKEKVEDAKASLQDVPKEIRQLKARPELKQPSRDTIDRADAAAKSARLEESKADKDYAQIQTRIESDSKHIDKLQQELQAIPTLSDAEFVSLNDKLIAAEAAATKLNALRGQYTRAVNQFSLAVASLRKASSNKRQMAKLLPVMEVTTATRKLLQKLPGRTVAEMAARMESTLNDKLGEMGMDFTLAVTVDLEFTVTRHGKQFSHTRLSGGQKCAAGLAFWLTVAEVMGLDTMFLDEPISSGFDEAGLANLPDMLTRVDAMCRRVGKQVVLITHHTQLMNLGHPLRIS